MEFGGHAQNNQSSQQGSPVSTDWTVYSPNVLRGNLGGGASERELEANDVRARVGWTSSASPGTLPEERMTVKDPISRDQLFVMGEDDTGDENTPRALDPNGGLMTYFPYPTLTLPRPELTTDFRMSATLHSRISVGNTPSGNNFWIPLTGGKWSATWGCGTVVPGGQDNQIVMPNGATRVEANYLLQTSDENPAFIKVNSRGWRTGPPEVLSRLANPLLADTVDPSQYKFRLFIQLETGDERYAGKTNCGMWVGSGMRKGAEVVYDAYRVS